MRILLTGGSGFTGGFVIRELLQRGHEVVALGRSATARTKVARAGAKAIEGDLDDRGALGGVFASAGADALVNLASLGFGHAPAIVAAASEAGLKRAVFVSTTAIFTSLPAPSKRVRMEAEKTIEDSDLGWTIVRPTMIYGAPGDRNIERLLRILRRSPLIPLPAGGRGEIQPVHVADLAWFVARALEDEASRKSYNVAGPDPLTLRAAVQVAAQAVGRRPILLSFPLRPVLAGVGLYERVTARPRLKTEQVRRLEEHKSFAIDEARSLGYRPRSFERGVEEEVRSLHLSMAAR